MEDLGIKIRALRESFDMTQTDFAKAINVSRGHIAFIENGGKVTQAILKKIVKFSKLPEEEFQKPFSDFEFNLTFKEYDANVDSKSHKELLNMYLELDRNYSHLLDSYQLVKENNILLKEKINYLEEKINQLSK